MASTSNSTLNHQSQCTVCLEDLTVRTTVTLRCRHTFHLDCLGSAFNAANEMRCPVCRAVEEGVWTTCPSSAPRISRAGASATIQGHVEEPPVQTQPPSGIYWSLDQGSASAGSLFGPLAGAAPVGQSMNSPSPAVRMMMRAAINRSSSHALLPAEWTALHAEGSGIVNIPLPYIGEVVLALGAVVQPGGGMDGSEDIMSHGEESAEDLSE